MEVVCHVEVHPWKVFMDGATGALGAGARIVIITPERIRVEHSFRLGFKASSNEVEYTALLIGLRAILNLGDREVEVYSDSRLVVNQVQGIFEAKDPRMIEYLRLVKQITNQFQKVKVVQSKGRINMLTL